MTNLDLAVVMPVYNEEEVIKKVVLEWLQTLDSLGMEYQLHVFNDGSKDGTLSQLQCIKGYENRLIIVDQENMGHGPTILNGYRKLQHATWVFQTDSDGEISPSEFYLLWQKRHDHDFLCGRRQNRNQPWSRLLISWVSRLTVHLTYGRGIWDVNSPFRLMRTQIFRDLFPLIPADTFAPNLIVTGWACRRSLRLHEEPITYQFRQTGTVSIKKWRLLKAAVNSFHQVFSFSFNGVR